MSEIAAPLPAEPAPAASAAARPLGLELRLTWEAAAYLSLLVVGAGMRFWDLGSRALHHDESLHGFYSYELYLGNGYEHNPLMHGPFQFFGMALTFFLSGGASDYTVRILPAFFGSLLILLPWLFRGRLGRTGAIFASALIAFSPTLLYYSRFARGDIYVGVFTLGLVVCLWRYLDERKPVFLYGAAALLALSFATKENTYVNAAILLVFLNLWLAADLARQCRRELNLGRVATALTYVFLYLPYAWLFAALWPFTKGLRERLGSRELPAAGEMLVVLGTLTAPQLAAAVRLPVEALGFELDTLSREQAVGIPTVLALIGLSALVGLGWNWRVWLFVAAAFYIPYAALFTSFGTHTAGFGSGIWESLDYWLNEQSLDQPRGNQPDWYYVTLLPAYEYLALAFAGPALLYFTLRGGPRSWLLTAVATLCLLAFFGADSFSATVGQIARPLSLPVAALALYFAVRGSPFERFLVFWTAGAIVGYSWVGEKMPWLSVHTSLPVLVLAAYSLGKVFGRLPSPRGLVRHAAALPLAAAVLGAAAVTFAAFGPSEDQTLRLALVGVALAPLLLLAPPFGRRRLGVLVASVLFGGLALFSVRTGIVAAFEHGDVPREMLIYTQTSPEVPDIMDRMERVARTSGLGHELPVVVDTTYTWPWAWYLRDYDVTYKSIGEDFELPEGAVLLIAREHEERIAPYLDRYQQPVPYRLRWWFPESYRDVGRDNLWLAVRDFGRNLTHGSTWETWWRYFRDREHPLGTEAIYSSAVFSSAYFPLAYDVAAGPDVEGRLAIGHAGDVPGALSDPGGVAVDARGNVYVADTGNARVQKFGPDGRLLKAVGVAGTAEAEFNQPSDLALDGEGNLYVLDSWNHRVQKFDSELNFVAAWGKAATTLIRPGPYEMWGPRSIAVDWQGNVWVADTGTNRVRKFSPDGEALATVGRQGGRPGEFSEPVGIAIDANAHQILVADAGNARIQRFDVELKPIVQYAVEEWEDRAPANKPNLAVLPDGRLLISDPAHGRVLLMGTDGRVAASLEAVAGEGLGAPRGLAYDEASGFVFVSEGTAGRVRRFPLSDFALR